MKTNISLFSSFFRSKNSCQKFNCASNLTALIPALILSSVFVAPSHGQQKIEEEIIVKGEFRDVSLLNLANSVNVIDEQAIQKRNANNLDELLNLAPNVNYSTGASRGRFIQIRGIGERSQFVSPINPSVGVVVDGIDMTGISLGVTALDAQQVEVFRGPQGTLYGANALAGLINVVGNRPEDKYFRIGGGIGNYNTHNIHGTASLTAGEVFGWRAAVKKVESDGFIDNKFLNRHDTNNIDEVSLRNMLTFAPSNDISIDLTTYYIDINNGYDAFNFDNSRTTFSDEPGRDTQETFANALKFEHRGVDSFSWQTTLSHASSDLEYGYDEDWVFQSYCDGLVNCFGYSWTDNYMRENKNTSFDTRLVSNAGSTFNWVAGLYYRDQEVDLDRLQIDSEAMAAVTNYQSNYKTENTAIYGQSDFMANDKIKITIGLRLEQRDAQFTDSDEVTFDPDESFFGGKISAEYLFDQGGIIYALASKGYKAGGFNPETRIDTELRSFDTENMQNYEIGAKGIWFDKRVTGQLSVFYQRRENMQVNQSFEAPKIDSEGSDFLIYIDNAAEGSNYGIEAELIWNTTDSLTLFSSFGYLNAEFIDFTNSNAEDLSGRDQAHAPNFQYLLGGDYDITDNLSIRIEAEGKDSFYFSDSHDEKSHPYDIFNLSMNYETSHWTISLWGKNLTDKDVETRGFLFGNDPAIGYEAQNFVQLGAPRTFGISTSYTF